MNISTTRTIFDTGSAIIFIPANDYDIVFPFISENKNCETTTVTMCDCRSI